ILFPNDPLHINGVGLTSNAQGPGDSMFERWTQPTQDQFDRGEIYLATYGKLTYKDFNGKEHWTQFCTLSVSKKYPHPPPIEASHKCIDFDDVDSEK
ncbi:MAG TPA: hypothetical protein VND66_00480, partial [Acidobacteriaceae bacterium]|nr:hypothetical protein [Acidobacteriaceae bacterium]